MLVHQYTQNRSMLFPAFMMVDNIAGSTHISCHKRDLADVAVSLGIELVMDPHCLEVAKKEIGE